MAALSLPFSLTPFPAHHLLLTYFMSFAYFVPFTRGKARTGVSDCFVPCWTVGVWNSARHAHSGTEDLLREEAASLGLSVALVALSPTPDSPGDDLRYGSQTPSPSPSSIPSTHKYTVTFQQQTTEEALLPRTGAASQRHVQLPAWLLPCCVT